MGLKRKQNDKAEERMYLRALSHKGMVKDRSREERSAEEASEIENLEQVDKSERKCVHSQERVINRSWLEAASRSLILA